MSAAADAGAEWMRAARRGDFPRAWAISDGVLSDRRDGGPDWHLPRHRQSVWDGRDLADRVVLVRCYHGLGDTIQFARFLPWLGEVARRVTVWAQPALVPLLAPVAGVARVLPLHDGTPEVDYDVDIEIMELAHAFRMTLGTLPAHVPYLCVPRAERLSQRYSVGVVAESGAWDSSRSIPPELLSAVLADRRDLSAFSLQLGTPVPRIPDASSGDILTLAARLRAVDLVVTVDTMIAHLAGALGVRVWTLLPFDADWRWLEARSDSPWYPTMRLFRQPAPGAWQPVADEVREMLACAR